MCKVDMQACVLHAVGDLRHETVPMPQRKPGEALVRILSSGICGSDVPRVFEKGTYRFPTIPGHEFAGVVEACDDTALVGQAVAVFPLLPCFRCPQCAQANWVQCADYNYFGSRCDGGFAEYLSVPLWNLVAVPQGVSMQEAAMCEPAAVARHAMLRSGIQPGQSVAIYGAGPIGLILGQWARAMGAGSVVLADIDDRKVRFAEEMGFMAVNSREDGAPAAIRALTDGGADVVIEGSGASSALEQCMQAAAAGGTVVLMGNPIGAMQLSQKGYWEILRKQLTLRGTWNSDYRAAHDDWHEAMAAMADGRLNLKPMVSHRFALCQCREAFELLREKKEFTAKVMFIMDEEERNK